ncbi:bifunctional 4-hydroxy-3-methylbut-2-enyl diphosphate reductase/30S ribosomal protein S1 [Natroniella sulfidigena]|uniref:bifunctional 4-hydroxy-3-methylbut-2-enyl diphosphate reductase/30S ribosomal protein S1 n=1 Tax=Natroniella sulfidigena TaxID=723921 RepID=UPI00200B2B3C|nr:bifunctional 4-hydroxy-3-methylbut-2-enyl diphosphate reductase/30S ribosomal protein S1 [Natroniella sulfidigena]MCK8817696.1 bifunctional 4-hydroxy-3-methylbut-2-enyl diphosphate reductase/30S ribosomal protein S1 [Natroniella sulfidigena]
MEIYLAEHAGFCFGVDRAMNLALKTGEDKDCEVFTLGPLIHNPQAVERLEESGVEVRAELENISNGAVIIRSHGVPPKILDQAAERDLELINATCPFVKRAQEKAKELKEEGYQVVISGDKEHPEVVGILGFADNEAIVVEDESDFDKLADEQKVGIIAQTTQSLENLQKLSNYLLTEVSELKVYNTICTTTGQRQNEAAELSKKVELMLVIGGHNSANTNRLAEICRESGVKTYHIEAVDDLQTNWFKNIKKVGITAGASTPNWIIKEVVRRMEEIKNEEEKNDVEATSLTEGEIVSGKIEEVSQEGISVDLGGDTEGFIPKDEIKEEDFEEEYNVGDEVEVEVLDPEGEDGRASLSKKKVDVEQAWEKVEEIHQSGEIIEAEVNDTVKGGLVVDIGVRGFIPASHVAIEYVEDLSQFVGQTLKLRIIEVEREDNNVVLSRKVVLDEERQEKKKEVLSSLEEGTEIEGEVTKLVDFGAFVELGGVEGLLHISEISWGRIGHPSEVLEEGEMINVKILGVDEEEGRVSLGLKQTQPDPWEEFLEEYNEGDIVEGKITKTVDFGAFMEIKPGVEGLIHISQLSHDHVATVEEVVTEGDVVKTKVINIEPEGRRVGLSIKELESPAPKQKKSKPKTTTRDNNNNNNNNEGSGVKLGDVFGDLFEE